MKKRLLLLCSIVLLTACNPFENGEPVDATEDETSETAESNKEEPAEEHEENVEEDEERVEGETNGEVMNWDNVKHPDNIVGKSDQDFSELTTNEPSEIKSNTDGTEKIITLSADVDIEEYLLSYSDLHSAAGEFHYIINLARNRTTLLHDVGGLLHIYVMEYIDGEEEGNSVLGSGELLKNYYIYPDGDIEVLQ